MIVILFGVSGAGKTVIGKLLAHERGWIFDDADDFHPAANIAKMRRGESLTDEDRAPWLKKLRERIEQHLAAQENAVVACSALKRSYRDRLRVNDEVRFVYLRGDSALIAQRLAGRRGHFMNPQLLARQFADLEEPDAAENALVVEVDRSPPEIADAINALLGPA